MSKDTTNQRRVSLGAGHDVGYCKPPEDHQFKPGQSGNLRGRPKGSKNKSFRSDPAWLHKIFLQEAHRIVSIDDPEGPSEMSMIQAAVRSLAINAQKGDHRAQKFYFGLLESQGRESSRVKRDLLQAAIDYKHEWQRVLERRRNVKSSQPNPVPHPDNIIIDFETGAVRIAGPVTEEENKLWERLKARKRESLASIKSLNELLQQSPDHPGATLIAEEIEQERRMHEMISTVISE